MDVLGPWHTSAFVRRSQLLGHDLVFAVEHKCTLVSLLGSVLHVSDTRNDVHAGFAMKIDGPVGTRVKNELAKDNKIQAAFRSTVGRRIEVGRMSEPIDRPRAKEARW